jgi:LacI family transcriptional regulator/LacI family repressor for deo operon, udp, cdd, tsx, nupC, and nupG
MGYVPNAVAQSLQGRRTNTIGIIVNSISDPFLADIIGGIEHIARPANYSVLLTASHNDPEVERQGLETFRQRRVDGVIMSSTAGIPPAAALKGMPCVFLNNQSVLPKTNVYAVSVDNVAGMLAATRHLIGLGHTAISYIGVTSRAASNADRTQGYRDALDGAGILIDERRVIQVATMISEPDQDINAGRTSLQRLIDTQTTAVVCYNDMVAIGLMLACRERGINVPGDLSIVGFDDVQMASYTEPALTTIEQPRRELGSVAMQNLLQLIDGKPARSLIVSSRLIVRGSSAPLARRPARAANREKRAKR